MLAAAEDGSQGPVLFALAETYDPNMLAAWGTHGVAPYVARAQVLYRKALSLGISAAFGRIEALPPVLRSPPTPVQLIEAVGRIPSDSRYLCAVAQHQHAPPSKIDEIDRHSSTLRVF